MENASVSDPSHLQEEQYLKTVPTKGHGYTAKDIEIKRKPPFQKRLPMKRTTHSQHSCLTFTM